MVYRKTSVYFDTKYYAYLWDWIMFSIWDDENYISFFFVSSCEFVSNNRLLKKHAKNQTCKFLHSTVDQFFFISNTELLRLSIKIKLNAIKNNMVTLKYKFIIYTFGFLDTDHARPNVVVSVTFGFVSMINEKTFLIS